MNKKLIIAAALCGLALGSRAQTEKGNFLLGGSFNFTSEKKDEGYPKTNSFGIGPHLGYFINDNFVIGLEASYYHSRTKSFIDHDNKLPSPNRSYSTEYKGYGFSIAPFVRYYVNLSPKFKFFGTLSANAGKTIGRSIDEYQNKYTYKYVSKYYDARLSPGFAFFPTKKFAIEFSSSLLTYQTDETSSTNHVSPPKRTDNYLQFGLNTIQPAIAFNYHF